MELTLASIRLLVRDYRTCFLFYRDTLGFAVAWGDEESGYADFDTGSVKLALFERQAMAEAIDNAGQPATAECQDRTVLCFDVTSVDAICQQLREKGVPLVAEPVDRTEWGVRTAHFRDPDGTLIEISTTLQT